MAAPMLTPKPMILLLLSCARAAALDDKLTPCQRCCAPGGDCSTAYKGQPGKCCGDVGGQAFCCPGASGGAKCYSCGSSFRCFNGFAASNICGGPPQRKRSHHHHGNYMEPHDTGMFEGLFMLMVLGAVVAAICWSRDTRPHYAPTFDQYGKPMGAMPVGQPVTGMPMGGCAYSGMPMGGCGYAPYGPGYSGMAMAGSAATGFMGGMLVSDMMHHHHDGGGDYGGGDYGGGDYGGGGGDGGFAADS